MEAPILRTKPPQRAVPICPHGDSNIIPSTGAPILKQKRLDRRFYAPTEIRTPVLTLKGLRPGPLDDGGVS